MRPTGYLLVSLIFVAVALLALLIVHAVGWKTRDDLALIVAAIVATQVGAIIWHRQAPATPLLWVKVGEGALLSVTLVFFALVYQLFGGALDSPEVTIPIAAVGCFLFPFGLVGPLWKQLSAAKPSASTPPTDQP